VVDCTDSQAYLSTLMLNTSTDYTGHKNAQCRSVVFSDVSRYNLCQVAGGARE